MIPNCGVPTDAGTSAGEKDGKVYRQQISRVVSFGIAASLSSVKDWLDNHIAEMPTLGDA